MTTETFDVGGQSHRVVWLRCRVKGSRKPDLLIVQLSVPDLVEPPTFYVDPSVVRVPRPPQPNEVVDGELMALLLDEGADGTLVVHVLGEALSYGPQLVVPEALAA